MHWAKSWRCDPVARAIADRHYNRQKVGSRNFVPPGACAVLRTVEGNAFWVSSMPKAEYVLHDWPGAWMCTAFRNESGRLSSELITQAVAATLALATVPLSPYGFVSFVDPSRVRHKRDPGRCFRKAGWVHVGYTRTYGLWVYQLTLDKFPSPQEPLQLEEQYALR